MVSPAAAVTRTNESSEGEGGLLVVVSLSARGPQIEAEHESVSLLFFIVEFTRPPARINELQGCEVS